VVSSYSDKIHSELLICPSPKQDKRKSVIYPLPEREVNPCFQRLSVCSVDTGFTVIPATWHQIIDLDYECSRFPDLVRGPLS
jgi:hypothetical protein